LRARPGVRTARPHDRLDLDGLDDSLGYHLRLAYVAASRHFAVAMARLDLTQKQLGVLWLIGANAGASQIAIARVLGMDRASMMAIIDRLEERSLVKRERSQHDGRRQALYLTPQGRRVWTQSKTALARHEHWMTGRFSADELATLSDLLNRFHR
jgi:MarR family transcriptional regulator, organic hydroperoxide resistance regulator